MNRRVLGKGMLKGAELAADKLNAKRRDRGQGSRGRPDRRRGRSRRPASKPPKRRSTTGLDGIVGPYNSCVGEETLPLYIEAGLVPIRLTSDTSTNGLGYTLQPMSDQIAPVASKALTDWLGAKTVAIAYDPTPGYT